MINVEQLKQNAKNITQKDVCIDYLKRSIARTPMQNWAGIVASYSLLKEHMQKVYNVEI